MSEPIQVLNLLSQKSYTEVEDELKRMISTRQSKQLQELGQHLGTSTWIRKHQEQSVVMYSMMQRTMGSRRREVRDFRAKLIRDSHFTLDDKVHVFSTLCQAAKDDKRLKSAAGTILELGVDANWQSKKKRKTLIHIAARHGQGDVCDMIAKRSRHWILRWLDWMLLRPTPIFMRVTKTGRNALHFAGKGGHKELMDALHRRTGLAIGGGVQSPLWTVVSTGNLKLYRDLTSFHRCTVQPKEHKAFEKVLKKLLKKEKFEEIVELVTTFKSSPFIPVEGKSLLYHLSVDQRRLDCAQKLLVWTNHIPFESSKDIFEALAGRSNDSDVKEFLEKLIKLIDESPKEMLRLALHLKLELLIDVSHDDFESVYTEFENDPQTLKHLFKLYLLKPMTQPLLEQKFMNHAIVNRWVDEMRQATRFQRSPKYLEQVKDDDALLEALYQAKLISGGEYFRYSKQPSPDAFTWENCFDALGGLAKDDVEGRSQLFNRVVTAEFSHDSFRKQSVLDKLSDYAIGQNDRHRLAQLIQKFPEEVLNGHTLNRLVDINFDDTIVEHIFRSHLKHRLLKQPLRESLMLWAITKKRGDLITQASFSTFPTSSQYIEMAKNDLFLVDALYQAKLISGGELFYHSCRLKQPRQDVCTSENALTAFKMAKTDTETANQLFDTAVNVLELSNLSKDYHERKLLEEFVDYATKQHDVTRYRILVKKYRSAIHLSPKQTEWVKDNVKGMSPESVGLVHPSDRIYYAALNDMSLENVSSYKVSDFTAAFFTAQNSNQDKIGDRVIVHLFSRDTVAFEEHLGSAIVNRLISRGDLEKIKKVKGFIFTVDHIKLATEKGQEKIRAWLLNEYPALQTALELKSLKDNLGL